MALFTKSVKPANAPESEAESPLPPELQKAMSKVTEIGSLPEVTARIIDVVENPKSTAHDMHEVVQADPALATKILKVVNSAFYGLPSQIASLDRAILMLGMNSVKNLALAASIAKLIRNGQLSSQFSARDLWYHSIAVGVCAKLLASTCRSVPADEAFVAGLVHDMGLIVMQQLFPERLTAVVDQCFHTPQNFCAAETAAIGASHQQFGGALATKWKFPPGLRHAVAYHHDPSSLQPEFQKVTAVIYLADMVCCQAKHGFYLTGQIHEPAQWMLDLTGLTLEQLQAAEAQLPERIAEAEQIFSVA